MVSKLCREFAGKTGAERKKLFADLLAAPVMHTDFTTAKINGKSVYVCVCASPDGQTLYFVREKKGHDGVKGTPVEDYQGILVHDHDYPNLYKIQTFWQKYCIYSKFIRKGFGFYF